MKQLEFLLEEASMGEVLRSILPKILPHEWQLDQNVFLRTFEGKSDLKKSIPKRVKVYQNIGFPVGVVILHDQDSADCRQLKENLIDLCSPGTIPILIRIVCKELESWYVGDLHAVEKAYPHFKANRYIHKAKFRNPDTCNVKDELKKILPELSQISSARAISPHLDIQNNRSESFKQFLNGLNLFLAKL